MSLKPDFQNRFQLFLSIYSLPSMKGLMTTLDSSLVDQLEGGQTVERVIGFGIGESVEKHSLRLAHGQVEFREIRTDGSVCQIQFHRCESSGGAR